jgi:alkanesulfonate monooxygenase SsuD/methylene tetrahydromethanopterin reductase-like flavin-dependent oxidoreductase (luciferase family)
VTTAAGAANRWRPCLPDLLATAGAIVVVSSIAPLRHPLLVARELGSLDLLSGGQLVVLPTVSWLAEEYEALGVP